MKKKDKKISSDKDENVIAYFPITTIPNVTKFVEESITIRFLIPWPLV